MNVTVATQQLKNKESDDSSDNHDDELNNVGEQGNEVNLDFNYTRTLKNKLENKRVVRKKVQNTTIMPQDLRKSDKVLKLTKQTKCDVDEAVLENSADTASSWRPYDYALDEDIYTITAAGHTTPSSSLQITSIDGFFNRKRGRPPKNRFVEVYKNTFQKPQAIFTSFKLEKQEQADAVANPENSVNNYLESYVETSKGPDNDIDNTIEYLRRKPTNKSSTLRKCLNRLNTNLATQRESSCSRCKNHQTQTCDKNSKISNIIRENAKDNKGIYLTCNKGCDLLLDECSTTVQNSTASDQHFGNHEMMPISLDSGPAPKKSKVCKAAENVTVIRAAGTFYPENSNENSNNLKQSSAEFTKKELSRNDVAQNLSLKDTMKIDTTSRFDSSTTSSTNVPDCSSILPQIYNVLQMQQQLFALYQQLALLNPALSHLDLKKFLAPILSNSHQMPNSPSPSSSTTPATGCETDLLFKKHSLNIISNLQNHQADQKTCGESTLETEADSCLSQLNKRTTSNKVKNRFQNTNTSLEVSAATHCTPDQNVLQKQSLHVRERIPTGYLRYRFNEDCGYEKCGYRQHQSHFHCNRIDCQYSFCDKTRFVQHTARHERLDTLMGSDFQQCRTTMICNYSNCPYSVNGTEDFSDILNGRKSSHFHCLKCPFVCADTNKVVAHRRLHSKMEFIRSAGFRKVTSNENCLISNFASNLDKCQRNENIVLSPDNFSSFTLQQFDEVCNQPSFETLPHCPYAMRLAHYHCLVCNYSVLSKSQLLNHKHRNLVVPNNNPPSLEMARLHASSEDRAHKEINAAH